MTHKDIKEEITQLLSQVEDKALLQQFHQWLQINTQIKTTDWWDELTDDEQKDLTQSREEVKNNDNLLDHDDVMKEAFSWKKQ
ncbi:hypothetical protein BH09BAC1_BH09BAC1_13630 [soil metagenome]